LKFGNSCRYLSGSPISRKLNTRGRHEQYERWEVGASVPNDSSTSHQGDESGNSLSGGALRRIHRVESGISLQLHRAATAAQHHLLIAPVPLRFPFRPAPMPLPSVLPLSFGHSELRVSVFGLLMQLHAELPPEHVEQPLFSIAHISAQPRVPIISK
jgi:hypothetical protein